MWLLFRKALKKVQNFVFWPNLWDPPPMQTLAQNQIFFTHLKYNLLEGMAPLRAPTSSSCGGLVAFGHLEDPSATWRALRTLWIAVKKNWTPIFFIGGPHLYPSLPPPPPPPPLPLAQSIFFLLPHQFVFQSDNFSIWPHILPQILPQTTTSIAIHPPTTFSVPKRNTGKCFERPSKILRWMQSSVPKRNTGKCLLTDGTDVKNVTEGRGGEGKGTRLVFLCG